MRRGDQGATSWGEHETIFLEWLRLRDAVGNALGRQELQRIDENVMEEATLRPPALSVCTRRCFRATLPKLLARGLVSRSSDGTWNLSREERRVAVDAAWCLIPAFHGEWTCLWDLQTLERRLGNGPFSLGSAAKVLQDQSRCGRTHDHHRGRRHVQTDPQQNLNRLRTKGWIDVRGPDIRIVPQGLDALTLLRLVVRRQAVIPPETLTALRIQRPPQ